MIYIIPKLDKAFQKGEEKFNLGAQINEKSFTKSDTPLSYRQINTLSKDKLFPEERTNNKGWRKFSLKELIYFSLIYELKRFGLTHDFLKDLSDSFFKEQTSEIAIICVLVRAEIMLTISVDGKITYYDPPHYLLMGRDNTPSIQIRLNDIVNSVYKKLGRKLVHITWSGRDYLFRKENSISNEEKEIISALRNNDYSTIRIRKSDGKVSLMHAEKIIDTTNISKPEIFRLLEAKDFQDISIVKRNGNIVSFKIEENIKL